MIPSNEVGGNRWGVSRVPEQVNAFVLFLQATGMVAGIAGVPVLVLALVLRRPSLARDARDRSPWEARWTTLDLFLAFFLAQAVLPLLAEQTLQASGFFTWLYGPAFPTDLPDPANPDPHLKQAAVLRQLWAMTLALPFTVATIGLLLYARHGTAPAAYGLTMRRAGPGIVVAYLAWWLVTPVVFLVFGMVSWLWTLATGLEPELHPIAELSQRLTGWEWVVFFAEISLAAPLLEELLFRGLLLPLLLGRPDRVMAVVALSFLLALMVNLDGIQTAINVGDWLRLARNLAPLGFVLLLVPIFAWLARRSDSVHPAIAASALLFAIAHVGVWPTPIPLLLLGYALGALTLWTRSILPAVVLHGLFNAVTGVSLVLGAT